MASKKIKIVQIIPELNLKVMGGIGIFLQTLLSFIDREKTENIILTYKSDALEREDYESLGIQVFSLLENTNLADKSAIETSKWLITTLKKIQPDIVTTHGFWGTTLGVQSAYKAQVPVITTIDDNIDLDDTPSQKRLKKRLANYNDCIVCVSNSVKNYAHQIEEIPLDKLRVIYNGINLTNYPLKLAHSSSLNKINSNENKIVFIARLEPQKVPFRAINAIASLSQKGYNCSLSIIGDGSLKNECEELTQQLQLNEQVTFLGYQEKPWQLVQPASIFVMTSDYEGFGLTITEAMASGCICVVPNLDPILEIASDQKEAIFYQAGNQADLENKLELVINLSTTQKQAIISQARARVEKVFNARIMAENYLTLYQELYWRKLAHQLKEKGELNKAISLYRKVNKIKPNDACCYQNLAEIMAQKGWRKEAINFYAQGWLSNAKEVKAWHENYRSMLLSKQQNKLSNQNLKSIFVVGCLHGGTTLMLRLLGNHPSFFALSCESSIFTKSASEIETQLAQWDQIYQQKESKIWIEKTPEHIYTIGKIFAHRPQSKIVWILRDGRDVLCSQFKTYQKHFQFEKLVNHWIASNIAGLSFLDDSRVKLVKYEDIVTNTEKTLTDIFNFLEEDYSQNILDLESKPFYFMNNQKITKPENIEEKKNISQLRNWQVNQPIFDGRGRWKKEMTPSQKEICKQKAQAYLVKFGYVTDDRW